MIRLATAKWASNFRKDEPRAMMRSIKMPSEPPVQIHDRDIGLLGTACGLYKKLIYFKILEDSCGPPAPSLWYPARKCFPIGIGSSDREEGAR